MQQYTAYLVTTQVYFFLSQFPIPHMADPIIKHNSTCPSLPLDLSDLGCFRTLVRNVTLLTLRICKYPPFETEFVRKCYGAMSRHIVKSLNIET